MSFILDALRKAERDRSLGQTPRMQDVALAPPAPAVAPAGLHRGRLAVVAALLALAIAAAAYWLLPRSSPPQAAPRVAPPGVVTASVRGPAPLTAPAAAPTRLAEAGTPALVDDGSLSSLDDLAAASDDAPTATVAAPATEPSQAVPPSQPRTADAPARPPSASDAPRAAASSPVDGAATPLDQMPSAYRAEFPAMTIEVHVWDSEPGRRFVMVNGHRYREGDTLAAGPRLDEIAQDGLVLDYRGSRVLYSLLLQQ